MKKLLNSAAFKFISSFKLFIWLCGLLLVPLVIGTLIPQNAPLEQYQARFSDSSIELIARLRLYDIFHSYTFYALLLLLALNAFCAALKRFAFKLERLGSSLLHVSVIIILIGALLSGLAGQRFTVNLNEGQSAAIGDFAIKLLDFELETEQGQAKGVIQVKFGSNCCPDTEFPAVAGQVHQLGATGYQLKVLKVFQDFSYDVATKQAENRSDVPNNPAVEIALSKEGRTQTLWLFAKYPDMFHQTKLPKDFSLAYVFQGGGGQILDYKSTLAVIDQGQVVKTQTIEVNKPLRYKGYSIFQTNYRPDDLTFSGLTVVRDPGVLFVYLGFALFFAGLVMILYVNPYLAKRRNKCVD